MNKFDFGPKFLLCFSVIALLFCVCILLVILIIGLMHDPLFFLIVLGVPALFLGIAYLLAKFLPDRWFSE